MRIYFYPLCFMAVFFCSDLDASWLCREASSQANGNEFYSCGVGEGDSIQESRTNALSSAQHEFQTICDQSIHCREFETTAKPLRTECLKVGNGYRCYRGIHYTVMDVKKKEIAVDTVKMRERINIKEKELRQLQRQIRDIVYLEDVDKKIATAHEQLKQLSKDQKNDLIRTKQQRHIKNQIEEQEIKLNQFKGKISKQAIQKGTYNYISQANDLNIYWGLLVGIRQVPFEDLDKCYLNVSSHFEKTFFNHLFGIRLGVGFLAYAKGDEDDRSASEATLFGTPNENREYYRSINGLEYSLSIPIYYKWYYLRVEVGRINLKQKRKYVKRDGTGLLISNNYEVETKTSQTFVGAALGIGHGKLYEDTNYSLGIELELGVRKYSGKDNIYPSLLIGLSFGW